LSLLAVLVSQPTRVRITASVGSTPREIKLTNLSSNSLTVSWVTDEVVSGAISAGGQTYPDDRGASLATRLHHITLKDLRPNQKYTFELLANGQKFTNAGRPYVFTTTQQSVTAPPAPFYLKGQTTGESLVYFTFNDSLPISTVTDKDGRFLLTLSNALKKNRQDYYPVQKSEKGYLLLQTNQGSETREVVVDEALTFSPVDDQLVIEQPGNNLAAALPPASAIGESAPLDKPRFNLLNWLRGLFRKE
jgi:hypothetical protein